MNVSITTLFILCPIIFLAGFIDSIGGGGGLISLPAYILAGLPIQNAVATNKLSSACGMIMSSLRYYKHNMLHKKYIIPGILSALIGSQIGAKLAMFVDERILQYFLFVTLPFITYFFIFRKKKATKTADISSLKQMFLIIFLTFIIGAYDGFYGPGSGTFLILVYSSFCGMNLLEANGNAKLVNLTSNLTAAIVFMLHGVVYIGLGLFAGVFSILGHFVGSKLAIKNGGHFIRIIIISVIIMLYIKLVTDIWHI